MWAIILLIPLVNAIWSGTKCSVNGVVTTMPDTYNLVLHKIGKTGASTSLSSICSSPQMQNLPISKKRDESTSCTVSCVYDNNGKNMKPCNDCVQCKGSAGKAIYQLPSEGCLTDMISTVEDSITQTTDAIQDASQSYTDIRVSTLRKDVYDLLSNASNTVLKIVNGTSTAFSTLVQGATSVITGDINHDINALTGSVSTALNTRASQMNKNSYEISQRQDAIQSAIMSASADSVDYTVKALAAISLVSRDVASSSDSVISFLNYLKELSNKNAATFTSNMKKMIDSIVSLGIAANKATAYYSKV